MEQQVQQFRVKKSLLEDLTNRIMEQVSSDIAPDEQLTAQFSTCLEQLREAYRAIRAMTDGMEDGLPVTVYAEAWAAKAMAAQVEKQAEPLRQFLRLTCEETRAASYLPALIEAQEKAKELLAELPLQEEPVYFRRMLQIVETGDYDEDELDEFEDLGFSRKLTSGLSRGYYHLRAEDVETGTETGGTQPPVEEVRIPRKEVRPPVVEVQTPVEETQPPAEEVQTLVEKVLAPAEEAQAPVKSTVRTALNTKELKTFSYTSKQYLALLQKLFMQNDATRPVLTMLSFLPLLNKEEIVFLGREHFDIKHPRLIEDALSTLSSKGLAAVYDDENGRSQYALSLNTSAVSAKDHVKSKLADKKSPYCMAWGNARGFGADSREDYLLVERRITGALLAFVYWLHSTGKQENFALVLNSLRRSRNGALTLRCFPDDKVVYTLLHAANPVVSMSGQTILAGDSAPGEDIDNDVLYLQLAPETVLLRRNAVGAWVPVFSPEPESKQETPNGEDSAKGERALDVQDKVGEISAINNGESIDEASAAGDEGMADDTTDDMDMRGVEETTDEESAPSVEDTTNVASSPGADNTTGEKSVTTGEDTKVSPAKSGPIQTVENGQRPERFLYGPLAEKSTVQMARAILRSYKQRESMDRAPSDEQILTLIQTLLAQESKLGFPGTGSNLIQALVLAAACNADPGAQQHFPLTSWLYRCLVPALHFPMDNVHYSTATLDMIDDCEEEALQALKLAASIHAILFTSSRDPEYYGIRASIENFCTQYDNFFFNWGELHPLLHTLNEIRKVELQEGFTDAVLAVAQGDSERCQKAEALAAEARQLRDTTPRTSVHFNGANAFFARRLGPNSDMAHCLSYVCAPGKPSMEDRELVKEYLRAFCGDAVDDDLFQVNDDLLKKYILDGVNEQRDMKVPSVLYGLSEKATKEFQKRLDVLISWYGLYELTEYSEQQIIAAWQRACNSLEAGIGELENRAPSAWRNVLIASLDCALQRMRLGDLHTCYSELLHTGLIPLDDKGTPVFEQLLYGVDYSQPWYLMLEHIASDPITLEQARENILKQNGTDNCIQLHQLESLLHLPLTSFDEKMLQDMEREAEAIERAVRDKLEESSVFGRMDDNERERLTSNIVALKPLLLAENENCVRDFGRWRHFLQAIERNIEHSEAIQRERMEQILRECTSAQKPDESDELLCELRSMIEEKNYAVAEEYAGLFQQGNRKIPESYRVTEAQSMDFDVFIDERNYDMLLSFCKQHSMRGLKSFGNDWFARQAPHFTAAMGRTWTARDQRSGCVLLERWPTRNGMPVSDICSLLTELGLSVKDGKKLTSHSPNADLYSVSLIPQPRNKEHYEHPIKHFGTTPDSEALVVCLFGSRSASSLLSDVTNCTAINTTTFVLLDFALDLSVRRQLADRVRSMQLGAHSPVILLDRTLMLYLSMLSQNERLRALLSCALPFAICQPFNGDRGKTADEMFAGRLQELNEVRRHNGACVVYGGRQLGKTALLLRAESLEHIPNLKRYAIYVDIINTTDERDVVEKILAEIRSKLYGTTVAERLQKCEDMSTLCQQLRSFIEDGLIDRFLLLLDETDKFLEAEAKRKFHAIWPLYRLWKNESHEKFKVVMAGLHNVRRTIAESNSQFDSPFGQMGTPLSIRPLSTADAQLLLMRPLQYLGFRIENEAVLKTILTYTCYFPGVIQFFGHQLVESVNGNYSNYFKPEKGNPPFLLAHEQLGAVMNSSEMNESIRDKIKLTLELDPRYMLLACCIDGYYLMDTLYEARGCSVSEIRDWAIAYKMDMLNALSDAELQALLDEMEIMGILVGSAEGGRKNYRFRRSTFKHILGTTEDKLETTIKEWRNKESVSR